MPDEQSHLDDALLDRWKYEDETLAQRTDWFLIFHAILLEAFFAAVSPSHLRQLPIALFGFLAGFLWLFIGIRQWRNHRHLAAVLKGSGLISPAIAKAFRGIDAVRDKQRWWMRWAVATPAFGILVPAAITSVWSAYLFTVADSAELIPGAFSTKKLIWTLAFMVAIAVGSFLWLLFYRGRPVFSNNDVELKS